MKLFCDHPKLTSEQVNIIPSRPLTSFTKGPEYAITRNFKNSVEADIDFRYCLSPYCFSDHVVTSCIGLFKKCPWFTFAHTEIGGGASFALLVEGRNIWFASTSSTGTCLFEPCCHSPEGFVELVQRGPREREARYFRFTVQRPGNLIYFPHLLSHAVLAVDTGSPTILSGWGAATTSDHQIILQTLEEYAFGLLVCVVISGTKSSVQKGLSALHEWVFSPSTGPQERKDKLQKHWKYWEQNFPNLILSLLVEKEVPGKIKCNRVPPRAVILTPLYA